MVSGASPTLAFSTVSSEQPYAALYTARGVAINTRTCPGETGRAVVAAWAEARRDEGTAFALLSEPEYRCLCSRLN